MPTICFVPGCRALHPIQRITNKLNKESNVSAFMAPKDPAVFKQWQRVIPRTDRLLTSRDVVCSNHFKKEDIISYNEPVQLYDGSVYLHMLDKPRLKKGAVPSIFPDIPHKSRCFSKSKSTGEIKCRKLKDQSFTRTKRLKVQKAPDHNYGAKITETEDRFETSKEKVLETDLSLLPSVILNCLTSESHTVLSTSSKTNTNECESPHSQSIPKNNISSESLTSSLQCHSENTAAKENVSIEQSKLSDVSKVPEKVSSFLKLLSSNIEIVSFQPNRKSVVSVKLQTIFKSSEVTKDISASSQEIVELSSDSQSNMTNSEVAHNHSDASNSSLDFREKFVHANHPNESTTKSYAILQPIEPVNIVSIDPDVILKPSSNLIKVTIEPKNTPKPKSITTKTEVIQPHPDTNVTNPKVYPAEQERDMIKPLSVQKNPFCFDFLKTNAHEIDNINSWWRVNIFDDFIIYVRWNSNCLVDRKIIIYKDLKIKVFLKEKEVFIENSLKATSIENISKLIRKVERLQLCENFLDNKRNCNGYIDERFICQQKNLCVNCIKWEQERLREEKQLKRLIRVKKDKVELT